MPTYKSATLAFPEFITSSVGAYDSTTHTWTLDDAATVPRSLRDYAIQNGEQMPPGFYSFFGYGSRFLIEREIDYICDSNPPGSGYDIRINIELERTGTANASRTLVWRHPAEIKAVFLGVGKTSKTTNDALRYFFGERHCLDRLTAEPWLINEYIQVVETLHGPLRAVIFNAMTATGHITPLLRILDPSCITSIEPLGVYTSLTDPSPPNIALPGATWKGWIPSSSMTEQDRQGLREFISVPSKDLETRNALIKQRTQKLHASGQIKNTEAVNRIIEKRLENT